MGAIVHDDRGRLLLVRRGTEPGRGQWSIPGGRVDPGETSLEAVVREIEEETALHIVPTRLAGVVERAGREGQVYVIEDWLARPAPGVDPAQVLAGDDAAEVGWFSGDELAALDCVEGLLEQLRTWEVVPPS